MKAGFHRLHFFFCNFTRPFKGVDTLGHSLPVSTQPGASALFNRVDAGPCLPAGSGFVIFLYRDLFSRVNTAGIENSFLQFSPPLLKPHLFLRRDRMRLLSVPILEPLLS